MRDAITIRRSTIADRPAIGRVAQLDSGAAPAGDALLALADGKLLAAVGLADGRAVADPFEFTAEIVELLRMRAAQESDGRPSGGRAGWSRRRLAALRAEEVRA